MVFDILALTVIAAVSFLAPYIASLIPGRPIPETVFLVFAGAALGPFGLNIIMPDAHAMKFMSEMGMAFLFLLAGYEIDSKKLMSSMGKHASLSWLVSLALALALVFFMPTPPGISGIGYLALANAMTTTAYGTLAPIMRDRGLSGTDVGDAVNVYGAIGEVLPVIAMSILLSTKTTMVSIGLLVAFFAICAAVVRVPAKAAHLGSKFMNFLRDNARTGTQAPVRLTVLLLISLVALSSVFDLDAVLGAFAAGFILRSALPNGDELLETKLEGIAYGFLVPAFFVISGAGINLNVITKEPLVIVGFMAALLLVRTVPIMLFLKHSKETAQFSYAQRISTAIYCTMALPLIVAITKLAVSLNAMSDDVASALIAAGALTVLIVPLVTSLTMKIGAAHPVEALQQIYENPESFSTIVHEHAAELHHISDDVANRIKRARRHDKWISYCDYLAQYDPDESLDHDTK